MDFESVFSPDQERRLVASYKTHWAMSHLYFCTRYNINVRPFKRLRTGNGHYLAGLRAIMSWGLESRIPDVLAIQEETIGNVVPSEINIWEKLYEHLRHICCLHMRDIGGFCIKFRLNIVTFKAWRAGHVTNADCFYKVCYWAYINDATYLLLHDDVVRLVEDVVFDEMKVFETVPLSYPSDVALMEYLEDRCLRYIFMYGLSENIECVTGRIGMNIDRITGWLKGRHACRLRVKIVAYLSRPSMHRIIPRALASLKAVELLLKDYDADAVIDGIRLADFSDWLCEHDGMWGTTESGKRLIAMALKIRADYELFASLAKYCACAAHKGESCNGAYVTACLREKRPPYRQSWELVKAYNANWTGSHAEFCKMYNLDASRFRKLRTKKRYFAGGLKALLDWVRKNNILTTPVVYDEPTDLSESTDVLTVDDMHTEHYSEIRSICAEHLVDASDFCRKFKLDAGLFFSWLVGDATSQECFCKACYWAYLNDRTYPLLSGNIVAAVEGFVLDEMKMSGIMLPSHPGDEQIIEALEGKRLKCVFMLSTLDTIACAAKTMGVRTAQVTEWLENDESRYLRLRVVPYLCRPFMHRLVARALRQLSIVDALPKDYDANLETCRIKAWQVSTALCRDSSAWIDSGYSISAVAMALRIHTDLNFFREAAKLYFPGV